MHIQYKKLYAHPYVFLYTASKFFNMNAFSIQSLTKELPEFTVLHHEGIKGIRVHKYFFKVYAHHLKNVLSFPLCDLCALW
ncbi:hypothetical protein CUJ83_01740 [Methanocella sp. CWC-04]|uniref:Uncharacterized protein n=1 Tax=Methanooceanicella nereidis TaxID=2052831 RepID=A0AAP2RCE8_9EURY|nr:hypothetical protein [Methanocella sp. CWC-04]